VSGDRNLVKFKRALNTGDSTEDDILDEGTP